MLILSKRVLLPSYVIMSFYIIISILDGKRFTVSAFVISWMIPTSIMKYRAIIMMRSKDNDGKGDNFIDNMQLYRKPKQKRRKPKNQKRPSAFWANIKNVEFELRLFWSSVNVPISSSEPPPIPNETLLNHYERHDLRYAIAKKGRKALSQELGKAKIIPGKWSDAIHQSEEVQCLLSPDNPAGSGLSKDAPPIAPHKQRRLVQSQVSKVKKRMHEVIMNSFLDGGESETRSTDHTSTRAITTKTFPDIMISESIMNGDDGIPDIAKINEVMFQHLRYSAGERWAQQENRKPRGYWSHEIIIEELFDFVTYTKKAKGRPSIWMPRHSEISDEGRNDLSQAITRYGGVHEICAMANLVPYKEWLYFESQLELFIELREYLAKHKNTVTKKKIGEKGGREVKLFFPKLADIRNNGHDRLHDLVGDFGGRKLIALKLDMEYQAQTKVEIFKGMSFGEFDLQFAIKLLLFMRKDMMEYEPVLDKGKQVNCEHDDIARPSANHIQMPTIGKLLQSGETQLAEDVKKYGGHECVARRLQLRFNAEEANSDAKAFRAAIANRN